MTTTYTIEDLGVQIRRNVYNVARRAIDPKSGHEVAVVCNFTGGGFTVVDLIARTARVIRPGHSARSSRNIAVAPDGSIYQMSRTHLCHWNWQGESTTSLVEIEGFHGFTTGVAPDGRVYIPNYHTNSMLRYDPTTGAVEDLGDYSQFGKYIRDVGCASDGWVYATCTDYHQLCVVGIDPQSGEKLKIFDSDIPDRPVSTLRIDSAGRIVEPFPRWGRAGYKELVGGAAVAVDDRDVMLTSDAHIESSQVAFSDGSYITSMKDTTVHFIDSDGKADEFDFEKEGHPLTCFSVAEGGGKIYCSTILPLRLFSHDIVSGEVEDLGVPIEGGEIYTMAFSHRKLYMASYGHSNLTKLDVDKPWKQDGTFHANPAFLGTIKEGRDAAELLHRPRGVTMAPDGTVFFAAVGDYGCEDSGICRINVDTEEVTRWLLPNCTAEALIYLPATDELLVSETRRNGEGIRFTFLSAQTGEVSRSEIELEDEGGVIAWLHDGDDTMYGLHNHRATLFAYSLTEKKILRSLPELRVGDHCYNTLIFGPDKRIWGLSNQCIYAVDTELSGVEVVAEYDSVPSFYRFGMVKAENGGIYFANGSSLMVCRESHQ